MSLKVGEVINSFTNRTMIFDPKSFYRKIENLYDINT